MFNSIIEDTFFLPASVQETVTLNPHNLQSGLEESGYAWVLSGTKLLIWSYAQGKDASVKVVSCPSAGSQKCFVRVVAKGSAVSVASCTEDGRLSVWLDAHYLAKPIEVHPIKSGPEVGEPVVAAMSAIAAESTGLIVIITGLEGSVYLCHAIPDQGVINPRKFNAGTAPSTHSSLGIVGKVGGLLGAMYAEAFNPLAKVQRSGASQRPAIGLSLQRVDEGRYRLLVLSDESLDCWMLSLGLRSGEELQWSYALQQVLRQELRQQAAPLALATSPSGGELYIWSASSTRPGYGAPQQQHHVHRLSLSSLSVPKVAGPPVAVTAAVQEASDVLRGEGHQMVVSSSGNAVLLKQPDGSLSYLEVAGGEGGCRALGADEDNLCVAAAGGAGGWLVLSATYGVLQLPESGDTEMPAAGALTPEQQAAMAALLDTTTSLMLQAARAGRQGYERIAQSLSRRLEALGLYASRDTLQLLRGYSRAVCDQVSKHWTGAGAAGGPGGVSLSEQLADKGARHLMLLEALAAAGLLQELPADIVGGVLEDGERLAAVAALLQAQSSMLREEVASGGASVEALQAASSQAHVWRDVVHSTTSQIISLAGDMCRTDAERALPAGDDSFQSPEELFYSRPTAAAGALLEAVRTAADETEQHLRDDSAAADVGVLRDQLEVVRRLLAAATDAAAAQRRSYLTSLVPAAALPALEVRRSDWLCDEAARSCWQALCRAMAALLRPTAGEDRLLAADSLLLAVGGLLGSCRHALSGAAEPRAMAREYRELRGEYAAVLFDEARQQLDLLEEAHEPGTVIDVPSDSLAWRLEPLLVQHHCYQQLYTLCGYLTALNPGAYQGLVLQHMAAIQAEPSAPQHCTFAWYVFESLEAGGDIRSLLGLPASFRPALTQFLEQRPRLLWMLQVKSGDMTAAASTLLSVGTAASDCGDRRDQMCLARLAAHASGDEAVGARAVQELRLLGVQEALGAAASPFLGVPGLVDAALHSEARLPRPVEAIKALLVLDPSERREQLAAQWEAAWRAALQCTDLARLAAARSAEARGEGGSWQYEEALRCSCLYMAARECAGRHGFGAAGSLVADDSELVQVQQWLDQWSVAAGPAGQQCALHAVSQALRDCGAEGLVAEGDGGDDGEAMVM